MQKSLKIEFPSQGWAQILTARKEMLDAYDRAREQARSHEVETFHGKVAESVCRKWLADFLPKRYGVTSGYLVSPGLSSRDKTPHFDVIIYDQLESPILWIEGSPDTSVQGRSLAIPAEYVRAVLEVKASFSAKTVRDALEHLADLSPLLAQVDAPTERYKLSLPPTFCCGVVFFELRKADAGNIAALSACINGIGMRGYFGGVILRGESHTLPHTGRLLITQSETPIENAVQFGEKPLLSVAVSESVPIADKVHVGSALMWSECGFAEFAFDLIAMIQGTFEASRLSSWYGIGSSFAERAVTPPGRGPD